MEGRVLIIEDHLARRQLISDRLREEGLTVTETATAESGIREAARSIPQAILVSTSLPDVPGLQVARRLREINRTKHVFLMMIGDKDNRGERLEGLDVGANDFISYPVDPDLVMLKVRNAIHRANLENHTDPITGMPAGRHLQEELQRLVRDPEGEWVLMHFTIRNLRPFREVHGLKEGDDLLRAVARVLAEALAEDDVENDFIGYGGHDDFVVITSKARAAELSSQVPPQVDKVIGTCGATDAEQGAGYIEFEGETYPLPSLRVRKVSPEDGPFYDIRSLSEVLGG